MPDDAEAEAGIADQHRDDPGEHHGDRDADPGRQAGIVPQQRHRIGANAEKGAMAKRHQPEPAHQRPARIDEAPDQDGDQQMQIVIAQPEERDGGQHGDGDQPGQDTRHLSASSTGCLAASGTSSG
jgi:hypothetical protein